MTIQRKSILYPVAFSVVLWICFFVLVYAASAGAQEFVDDTGTLRRAGYGAPAPTTNNPTLGFGSSMATTTIPIPATGKTNLGQYLAADARVVAFTFFGGDVILNSTTNLATGSIYTGWKIASGSFYLEREIGRPVGSYTLFAAPNGTDAATATAVYWK